MFARAEASVADGVRVVRHLLGGCPECSQRLAEIFRPQPVASEVYSVPVARACREVLRRDGHEEPAQVLLADLDGHVAGRRVLLANQRRFASARLAGLLLDESDEARGVAPKTMVERAALAVRVASHSGIPVDTKVRAWGTLGNANRIVGDYSAAERWLSAACGCAEACVDPTLRPRVIRYLASLRLDEGRFDECLDLLSRAVGLWRTLGDRQEVGASLALAGLACAEAGKPAEGILHLIEASKTVDPWADPRINLVIVHNLARCQLDAGKPLAAMEIMVQAGSLYLVVADEVLRTKGVWLRGQIHGAMGNFDSAVALLSHTRSTLTERGQLREAVAASLDLACSLARLGRSTEVTAVAVEVLALARGAGAATEAVAAISLLAETRRPSPRVALELALGACAAAKRARYRNPVSL